MNIHTLYPVFKGGVFVSCSPQSLCQRKWLLFARHFVCSYLNAETDKQIWAIAAW